MEDGRTALEPTFHQHVNQKMIEAYRTLEFIERTAMVRPVIEYGSDHLIRRYDTIYIR